jgi:Secretion system C-terminal sorting domain
MKKHLCLEMLLLLLSISGLSQSTWKFHIAFEDSTGAKDTIWCIWDTTATLNISPGPYDTIFNEGPAITNQNIFNVFIYNYNAQQTKTIANPFTSPYFEPIVHAINYQYPIYISWDSILFNSVGAPDVSGSVYHAKINNDYFFGVNNNPPAQMFNMLWDNNVIAPFFTWGSQTQFPMFFSIYGQIVGVSEMNRKSLDIRIYPNPFNDIISIQSNSAVINTELLDINGRTIFVKNYSFNSDDYSITLPSQIPLGVYLLKLTTSTNLIYHEKIIKSSP